MNSGILDEIVVAARFRGPPTSGNGGYCSGLLAEYLTPNGEPGGIIARLNAPVPLDRQLQVLARADDIALVDPEQDLGLITARKEALDLTVPVLPPLEEVKAAAGRYWRPMGDQFNGCFGCCHKRAPDEAIRVLAGPFAKSPDDAGDRAGMAADLWHADPTFASADGSLAPRYVWTAMDCSGGLAAQHFNDKTMLTGGMHIRQLAPVMTGRDYVVLVWPIAAAGRKITTGSAIYDLDGKVLVLGRLTWIVLRDH